MGVIERLREHLDLPAPPPVHITFCGRKAVTTGVVNMRLLMGDAYHHLVERVSAERLERGGANDKGDDAELLSPPHGKAATLYTLCPSDGLPQGCYRVHEGGEYWVAREGGGGAVGAALQHASSQAVPRATHTDSDTASEVIDKDEMKAPPAPKTKGVTRARRAATAHRPPTAVPPTPHEEKEEATQAMTREESNSARSSSGRSGSDDRAKDEARRRRKEEKRKRKEERHRRREERRQRKEEKRRRRRERESSTQDSSVRTTESTAATAVRSPSLARADSATREAEETHIGHVTQPLSAPPQQRQTKTTTSNGALHDMMDRTVERLLQAKNATPAASPPSQPQLTSSSAAPVTRKRHRRSISLTRNTSAVAAAAERNKSSTDEDEEDKHGDKESMTGRASHGSHDAPVEQNVTPSMDEPAIYKKAKRPAPTPARASLERPPRRPAQPTTRRSPQHARHATRDSAAKQSASVSENTTLATTTNARPLRRRTSCSTTRRSPPHHSPPPPSPSLHPTEVVVTAASTGTTPATQKKTPTTNATRETNHTTSVLPHTSSRSSPAIRASDGKQARRGETSNAAAAVAGGRQTVETHGRQESSRSPQSGSVMAGAAVPSVAATGNLPQESPALMFTPIYNSLAEEFSLNPSSASSSGDSDYLYE